MLIWEKMIKSQPIRMTSRSLKTHPNTDRFLENLSNFISKYQFFGQSDFWKTYPYLVARMSFPEIGLVYDPIFNKKLYGWVSQKSVWLMLRKLANQKQKLVFGVLEFVSKNGWRCVPFDNKWQNITMVWKCGFLDLCDRFSILLILSISKSSCSQN